MRRSKTKAQRTWDLMTGPEQEYMHLIAQEFELTIPDQVVWHLGQCDCCQFALERIRKGGKARPPPKGRYTGKNIA